MGYNLDSIDWVHLSVFISIQEFHCWQINRIRGLTGGLCFLGTKWNSWLWGQSQWALVLLSSWGLWINPRLLVPLEVFAGWGHTQPVNQKRARTSLFIWGSPSPLWPHCILKESWRNYWYCVDFPPFWFFSLWTHHLLPVCTSNHHSLSWAYMERTNVLVDQTVWQGKTSKPGKVCALWSRLSLLAESACILKPSFYRWETLKIRGVSDVSRA